MRLSDLRKLAKAADSGLTRSDDVRARVPGTLSADWTRARSCDFDPHADEAASPTKTTTGATQRFLSVTSKRAASPTVSPVAPAKVSNPPRRRDGCFVYHSRAKKSWNR